MTRFDSVFLMIPPLLSQKNEYHNVQSQLDAGHQPCDTDSEIVLQAWAGTCQAIISRDWAAFQTRFQGIPLRCYLCNNHQSMEDGNQTLLHFAVLNQQVCLSAANIIVVYLMNAGLGKYLLDGTYYGLLRHSSASLALSLIGFVL